LQHTATRRTTMQHTAERCNTLQRTAIHGRTPQHCNTDLRYTLANTVMALEEFVKHNATHRNTPQYNASHCNTLQHTATHCRTLQYATTQTCITLLPTQRWLSRSSWASITSYIDHTYTCVMSHKHESCHTHMCHVTRTWVLSHIVSVDNLTHRPHL